MITICQSQLQTRPVVLIDTSEHIQYNIIYFKSKDF